MSSTLDIWNMALGFVGVARRLASENEASPEGAQCRLYWENARRQALRDYPWTFAQCRERLAEMKLPEEWEGIWRYAYALPSRCLRLQAVSEPGCRRDLPHEVVRYSDGTRAVMCNVNQAIATYTRDVTDVAQWDDGFIHAVARRLACQIGIALLKNNPQKLQELEQMYSAVISKAHDEDSSEREDRHEVDSWIKAREAWS